MLVNKYTLFSCFTMLIIFCLVNIIFLSLSLINLNCVKIFFAQYLIINLIVITSKIYFGHLGKRNPFNSISCPLLLAYGDSANKTASVLICVTTGILTIWVCQIKLLLDDHDLIHIHGTDSSHMQVAFRDIGYYDLYNNRSKINNTNHRGVIVRPHIKKSFYIPYIQYGIVGRIIYSRETIRKVLGCINQPYLMGRIKTDSLEKVQQLESPLDRQIIHFLTTYDNYGLLNSSCQEAAIDLANILGDTMLRMTDTKSILMLILVSLSGEFIIQTINKFYVLVDIN